MLVNTFACFYRHCFSRFFPLLLAALALFCIAGCKEDKKQGQSAPPPTPVNVFKAITKTTPVFINAVGAISAAETVKVKPQTTGRIIGTHFLDGDTIKAGQLLFTIDEKPLKLQKETEAFKASTDRSAAELAEKDLARYKKLFAQGVVSREEYDQKFSAAKQAREQLKAQEAQVNLAGESLKYTSVTSPIDGVAGNALVDVGNVIYSQDEVLVVIKNLDSVELEFSVPQRYLHQVRDAYETGHVEVLASAQGEDHAPRSGLMDFIDNWVDADTGMISCKARFDNKDAFFWPGQFVTAKVIVRELKDAVQIPVIAAQPGPAGDFVYVVKDKKAEMRPVVLSVRDGDNVVVEKGLAAGETVVTKGMIRLYPNASVLITQDKGKAEATPATDAKSKPAAKPTATPDATPNAKPKAKPDTAKQEKNG